MAIPTLDGASTLDRTLKAVRAQRGAGDVEIVVLDSQSADGTREVARRHGAAVHTIERADFRHGPARNRLMELTGGDHVAFLTQDAEPAGDEWLARLQAGFESAPDVAMVCGPYRPRPGATVATRRELSEWFARMHDGAPRVYRAADLPDPVMPGPASFASSANLCLSRAAWKEVPFRDVLYAEDQRLAVDLLQAGYAKVFDPHAAVVHSHEYRPLERLRRHFDESRALHEVYGWTAPARPRVLLGTVRAEVRRDRALLRSEGADGAALTRATLACVGHHSARALGDALGSRAGSLPAGLRRRLSLEGRA